jgi:branched-chain amino acid transport system ATP-binding protein
LIDHDVSLIAACCEATIGLDFGNLLAHGPTKEVLASPEVRLAYMGEASGTGDTEEESSVNFRAIA